MEATGSNGLAEGIKVGLSLGRIKFSGGPNKFGEGNRYHGVVGPR